MTHHPWRQLRDRPEIDLAWADLPAGLHADTDGHGHIRMHRRLLQVERRCAIDHELAHIELGHICGADSRQELAARKLSAGRLVHIRDLCGAVRWTLDRHQLADELWVTVPVLLDRVKYMRHPGEIELLGRAVAHHGEQA